MFLNLFGKIRTKLVGQLFTYTIITQSYSINMNDKAQIIWQELDENVWVHIEIRDWPMYRRTDIFPDI